MKIDHIHFYVHQAVATRDWFMQTMGFQSWGQHINEHTHTEIVGSNAVLFHISAARNDSSPVAQYLSLHPPGVVDIAFVVDDLELLSAKIAHLGIPIKQQEVTTSTAPQITIPGWGDYQHTLMTVASHQRSPANTPESSAIASIDHVVLNVGKDQLNAAAHWYRELFGFQIQQAFDIQTDYSGLYSQALVDPAGQVQFNINEPSTPTSQIQTFLDIHNGAGIQHIGLRTFDIVTAVDQMRAHGLSFLSIPRHYYANLLGRMEQTNHFPCHQQEWPEIEKLEILLDWPTTDRSSLLLQIFTQPIFEQPTFFLEIIERRHQAQGFGEGNFLALFQAMEAAELSQRNH